MLTCTDGTCGNAAPGLMGPGYCPRCTIQSKTAAEWRAVRPERKAMPTCPHRGEPTGERVQCSTCSKRVMLTVFSCSENGRCTMGQNADGVAACDSFPGRK